MSVFFRGSKTITGYDWERPDAEEPLDYVPYCAATVTTFVYGTTPQGITKDEAKAWAEAVNYDVYDHTQIAKELVPGINVTKECLYDPNTTIKVMLMIKKGTNDLLITFGAMDSFITEVLPEDRDITYIKQTMQIIGNLAGLVPSAYKKAANLISVLRGLDLFKWRKITLAGQSFGGSLASYVALKLRMEAVIFNPLALGAGLQKDITDDNLKEARKYVKIISVDGDFASDSWWIRRAADKLISFIGIRTPGNFGTRESVMSVYTCDLLGFQTHESIASITYAADLGKGADSGKALALKISRRAKQIT